MSLGGAILAHTSPAAPTTPSHTSSFPEVSVDRCGAPSGDGRDLLGGGREGEREGGREGVSG